MHQDDQQQRVQQQTCDDNRAEVEVKLFSHARESIVQMMPVDWIRANIVWQMSSFLEFLLAHVRDRTIIASVVIEHAVEHCLWSKPHAIDLVHGTVIACLFNHFDEINGIGRSNAMSRGLWSSKESEIVNIEVW